MTRSQTAMTNDAITFSRIKFTRSFEAYHSHQLLITYCYACYHGNRYCSLLTAVNAS